jgi:homoserine O-succinyltransferase
MPLFLESSQTGSAAEINAANGISVGLINNMPDAALDATARQFTNLLGAAAPNLAVVLKLFALPGVPRAEAARRTLAQKYRDISELWDTPLDGLIVTGTEPRAANLMDEPYWETLSKVVDWSRDNTASTIWSCLAAHAAVLHADGIVRCARDEKQLGVFDCRRVTAHPMTQHFPESLWVPHSRHNDLPEEALVSSGYKILTRSAEAGVDMFARQDGSFSLFFQGHPEYEADSLFREYRRDAIRFLNGYREHYPALPRHYFNEQALATAEAFRARALAERHAGLAAEFPTLALEGGLNCPWRPAALGTYERWIAYLAARKAERRVMPVPQRAVRLRRTWRDWPAGLRRAGTTSVR